MTNPNNNIHNKYDQNWVKEVKKQSLILNGSETDDTKKKSKQLEQLLTDRETLQTQKEEKITKLRKLENQKKELVNVAAYLRAVDKEKRRLKTNKTTHKSRMSNFLGEAFGSTNTTVPTTKWGTNGWIKDTAAHFTPASEKLDNLYKVKINNTEFETTEEQVINTAARVVLALKNVDLGDFTAKYNAKESDTTKQQKVKNYLTNLQKQEIVKGSRSYDFAESYQKYDQATKLWTAYTAPKFNYNEFFEFIELTHDQAFLNDLDADKQKNVEKPQPWSISLKGEAWEPKDLKDYGINVDPTKTTLYKTSHSQQTITAGQGISGWLELAHTITYLDDNKTKIVGAFNNSPTQKLIDDLKTWTINNGFLTNGTNLTLPESYGEIKREFDRLEMEKTGASLKLVELNKEIAEETTTRDAKQTEINSKEAEIDTLIKEILAKKREQLKDYHLAKGFKKTDSEDNRRTVLQLRNIQQILEEIRYLENDGNSTLPSPQAEENAAFIEAETLIKDYGPYNKKCSLIDKFEDLGLVKENDGKSDIQQAINHIKAGKYTDKNGQEQPVYVKLEAFAEHFVVKEKMIKLNHWEEKALAAIKVALGKKEDPTDTLQTYQEKLKALDPLLDETIITQAIVDDWKTHHNFKTASTMEAEIKKVFKNGALDEDFAKLIKKADAEITDLANLFKKKQAKEIIILIRRWEYDKNTDQDKRKKLVWTLELKDDQGQYLDDKELTEEEINSVLYDLAVGNKTLASAKKENETDKNDDNQGEETGHLKNYWHWYALGTLGVVILLGVVFWKKISEWFGGKSEEGLEDKIEKETNEDEE